MKTYNFKDITFPDEETMKRSEAIEALGIDRDTLKNLLKKVNSCKEGMKSKIIKQMLLDYEYTEDEIKFIFLEYLSYLVKQANELSNE